MPWVLVIDDDEHIRQLVELELTEAGYDVVAIARDDGVLQQMKTIQPNVAILDLQLADHGGLDLLQQIREAYPHMPIILCSPYDSYKSSPKAAAADFYVIKSHDLADLRIKVKRAVTARSHAQSPSQVQFTQDRESFSSWCAMG